MSTLVEKENKTHFVRVWKPSPTRRVLKSQGEARKGKFKENGQYLLVVDLGRYKWYQNQTLDYVRGSRLFPKWGRHETVC